MVHILACGWALTAQLYGSLRDVIQVDLEQAVKVCRGMDGLDSSECLAPGHAGSCSGCVRLSNGGDDITSAVCTESDCLTDCETVLYAKIQGPDNEFDVPRHQPLPGGAPLPLRTPFAPARL